MTDPISTSIVILISGSGTNLQAIIDSVQSGQLNASIIAVLSNKPNAGGLQRATKAGIRTCVVDNKAFASRELFDERLLLEINALKPDLVILAGFMRILSPEFVNELKGRLINIHPSLLPRYKGINTHQRALDARDKTHGCSIHFVTEELDGGPVIAQSEVAVYTGDNPDTLASRVQTEEHRLYPLCIEWLCSKKLQLINGTPVLNNKELPENGVKFKDSDYRSFFME